jgi:hypothetical protein
MDYIKLLELILDRLFSWPVMVFLIILALSLIFKSPLYALIHRIIKLKVGNEWVAIDTPTDASATARQLESRPAETGLALENKPVEAGSGLKYSSVVANGESVDRLQQLKNFGVPTIVQEQETLVHNELKKLNISQEEIIKLLVRHPKLH